MGEARPVIAATYILPDEKVWTLSEVNLRRPDHRGFDRYQILYVDRNGLVAEWRQSLGPADQFKASEFRILGLWEATVAELQEEALELREDLDRPAVKFLEGLKEQAAEGGLTNAYYEYAEQVAKEVRNQSLLGPKQAIQRNK